MTWTLLAAYFAFMVATLVLASRPVGGRWIFLLRAFFPNWKFFDIVGHVPHLMARAATTDDQGQLVWTDWSLIYPRRQRRWFHVFHNPDTNLGLGQQNLVDHFWADLNDLPDGADPRDLVTYAKMEHLVHDHLTRRHGAFSHRQFELRMVLDGRDGPVDTYTMMTAPVRAC